MNDRAATPQKVRSMRTSREPAKLQRIALGCLTTKHPVRRVCIKIYQSPWFGRVILLVVCFNTVILGLVDYTHAWAEGPNPNVGINHLIEQFNGVSLYLFLGELFVKVVAMGLVVGDGAYFSDNWNRLDFVIVLSGMLSLFNIHVGFIRVLRVLRPLRTLHTFPGKTDSVLHDVGLKVLTKSLLASLPALGNVAILLAFSYVVFAILGMEIWRGAFHSRCRLTPFPIALPFNPLDPPPDSYPLNASYLSEVIAHPEWFRCNKSDGSPYLVNETWLTPANCFWPLDSGLPMPRLCSSSGRACNWNNTCGSNYDSNGNPRFVDIAGPALNFSIMNEPTFNPGLNFGFTNFDNLGNTLMVILQVVTASGWMALTETAQWVGNPALAALYFNALLFFGMCFLLQLNMAVLFTEFEKAKDQQAKIADAEAYTAATCRLGPNEYEFRAEVMHRLSMMPPPVVQPTQTRQLKVQDVVIASAWTRRLLRFRILVRSLVLTNEFRRLGVFITLANIFIMSLNHTEMSHDFAYNSEVLNFAFMLYFGLESVLKMIGLELAPFWADKFNRFDLFTFLMGIAEAVMNPPTFIDGTAGGSGLFTAFRVARAFKLARSWKSLNKLLMAILNSFGEILNFLFFLVLFCYIYALLGMEIFATKFQFDPSNYALPFNTTNPAAQVHRSNFDSVTWAFFTVFQIITYDNFPSVVYDGWISVGWVSPVYFASIIIFGVWIVMNMFSAILVQSCMVDDEDDDAEPLAEDAQTAVRRARHAKRAMFQLLRYFNANTHDPDEARRKENAEYLLNTGDSLFIFSPHNPIRRVCIMLLQRREWSWFIAVSVFVSCIFTAIDSPLLDPGSSLGQSIAMSNSVFAIIFSCELTIAVIAKGLLFGRGAYLKDPWRILDGCIVTVSVLPYVLGNAKGALSGLRALRAFRAFRPLRVINNLPQLKIVVNTLFRCIPDIMNAL
ncbi:Voltage-gated Ion Channel (VIC) Superfamily, partial [Achlya hypogyna]